MLLVWMPSYASTRNVNLRTLTSTGLPVVVVETINHEEPTCEYLTVDSGYPGNTIRNATKVPGRVVVIEQDDTLYDSGPWEKDISGMTIKMRGNNSALRFKHPFKLKLQKKADMLTRGNDSKYKDKEWVLLDGSTLNFMTGMMVSQMIGIQWSPAFKYVNLLFNGEYRGIFILCESVKRNPNCRLNVDKDEGFIVEKDAYWWNEDVYFQSTASRRKYTFKYPDPDDITSEQVAYAQQRISEWESSVAEGTFDNYIDIESFATWLLAHDILGNADAAGSNIYLTCYDSISKIQMGNLWDLDTNFYNENQWSTIHTWWDFPFGAMLENKNLSFALAYIQKWEATAPWLFTKLEASLDSFLISESCQALERSRKIENDSVGFHYPTIAEGIDEARQWFTRREVWLWEAITAFKEQVMCVSINAPEIEPSQHPAYHIDGLRATTQRGNATHHPLYIKNGRKFFLF